jgi:endonuclease/exonuclease/phosphatase family metal-dependent hydrolase
MQAWTTQTTTRQPVTVHTGTLRFATWNIGGGILGESHQRGARPSLEYYASVLKKHSPDVACLQEAHSFDDGEGQTEYLARKCGYPYAAAFPVSRSHLANAASLALGILSRFPIETRQYRQFPNPGLTSRGPDGSRWELLDKGYAKAVIDVSGLRLGVLNAHCFPLHYFSAAATDPRFRGVWRMLAGDLLDLRQHMLAIAGMDLNYAPVQDLLADPLGSGRYASAFTETSTTRKGVQQDYILYDQRMELLETTVLATESDHSYCQVKIALQPTEELAGEPPPRTARNADLDYWSFTMR